jgi:hypothetical protein
MPQTSRNLQRRHPIQAQLPHHRSFLEFLHAPQSKARTPSNASRND